MSRSAKAIANIVILNKLPAKCLNTEQLGIILSLPEQVLRDDVNQALEARHA